MGVLYIVILLQMLTQLLMNYCQNKLDPKFTLIHIQKKNCIPPPYVFAAPFKKEKPQGKVSVGNDECVF